MEALHNKLIAYRPEIDGLRAVAVLPVVIFHAFPGRLPGGFVGVDVFFVISGYLITKIIYKEVRAGRFSIIRFYSRRARRIFPALILVILGCLLAGWYLLLPTEFRSLGKHTFFGSFFSQNINLLLEAGYFDSSSKEKVHLHLWSLAVEEQFYLIWPVAILLLFSVSRTLGGIIAIATLSLAASVIASYDKPVFAFYLPFTRFWELGLGGLAAYFEVEGRLKTASSTALPAAGILLIVLSFFFINENQRFPGWIAAFPVIGTLLVIVGSSESWISRHLLSNKIAVFIGLISYPLYLWHWPVLVFLFIYAGGWAPREYRLAAVVVSFILATVTYLYVERPLRLSRQKLTPAALTLVLFATGFFGVAVFATDGFSARTRFEQYDDAALKQVGVWNYWQNSICEARYPFEHKEGRWWFCIQNKDERPTLLLLGNSHVNDLYPGLVKSDAFRHHTVLSIGTCSPEADPVLVTDGDKNNPCFGERRFQQYEFINQVISKERPDFVIMMSKWPSNSRLAPGAQDDFVRRIGKRISQLEELGSKVILVLPRPKLHNNIKNCYSRPFRPATSDCKVSEAEARSEFSGISSRLTALADSHPDLGIFDPFPIFCKDGVCEFRNENGPLLRDEIVEHLSMLGSDVFSQYLAAWARENMPLILARPQIPADYSLPVKSMAESPTLPTVSQIDKKL